MKEMMSLYDFLGRPAGGKLGKEVMAVAVEQRIKCKTREVDNPTYTGIVYLYPKEFLQTYFRDKL